MSALKEPTRPIFEINLSLETKIGFFATILNKKTMIRPEPKPVSKQRLYRRQIMFFFVVGYEVLKSDGTSKTQKY